MSGDGPLNIAKLLQRFAKNILSHNELLEMLFNDKNMVKKEIKHTDSEYPIEPFEK